MRPDEDDRPALEGEVATVAEGRQPPEDEEPTQRGRPRGETPRPSPGRVGLTIVLPVAGPHGDLLERVRDLAREAASLRRTYEILVVADAPRRAAAAALARALPRGDAIEVLALRAESGESAALRAAFRVARGALVVTAPVRDLAGPGSLARVVERLDAGGGLVLARRARVSASPLVHWLLRRLTNLPVSDLGFGLRGMSRRVAKELADHEQIHRFLPFLAHRHGHAVQEVEVEPGRVRSAGTASPIRGALDLLAILFLLHFARAPLRMFGAIGTLVGLAGAGIVGVATAQRFLEGIPLSRRPALVLGVLLIVLGAQTVALGLLGEITVFAHSRRQRDYRVERISPPRPGSRG